MSPYIAPFVQNSYALNFIYWHVFHWAQRHQPDQTWQWLRSLYEHPEVWWLHQQELLAIHEGAKAEGIPFLVIIFPSMSQLEESRPITSKLVDLFREHNVPTLDVASLVKDIPVSERMASPVDPHPSEAVHAVVGQALHDIFYSKKW